MAIYNVSKFRKNAQKYGVECQLIMGKGKGNVIALICDGYTFDRLSLYGLEGDDDIDMLMSDIACDGAKKAYERHTWDRTSVATHKVNNAHGRTHDERYINKNKQVMTYASSVENIQFSNQKLSFVFDQVYEKYKILPEKWVRMIAGMHKNAKKKCMEMLNSGDMLIFENHVIHRSHFEQAAEFWGKINNIEVTKNQIDYAILKYCTTDYTFSD